MADSTTEKPTITVLGCGYVGVTTAVVLANCGYKVFAIEPMPERLNVLKSGRSFFYEPGVDSLITAALKAGTLTFTDSYEQAVPASSIVFSCVGTPDNADGSSNLTYIFNSAQSAGKLMKPGTLFVQKSTVPVGTGRRVMQTFAEAGVQLRYVSNPEFLSESSAIRDTLWFDRCVTGSDNAEAAQAVLDTYRDIEQHAPELTKLARIDSPSKLPQPEYTNTNLNSAELIKVSSNAFLALKISFANSIAKLADKAGADVAQVMDAVGADHRIGRAFFNAGRGFGGGCFPKDVSGLIRAAEEYGVDMEIMSAATVVNESMPHYIVNKAGKALDSSAGGNVFKGKNVAVLGLSFKAGTSDVRRSPAIVIANTLAEQGAHVRAYDPEAMEESRPLLDPAIELAEDVPAAVRNADAVFVATDWAQFVSMLDLAELAETSGAKIFVDCMNRFDAGSVKSTGMTYVGVGKG